MPRSLEYTEAMGDKICSMIAAGESVLKLSKTKGFPTQQTIFKWRNLVPEFAEKYARAREQQMEAWAEEIVKLADQANSETFNAQRLKVDTRKWLMSKLAPKKYGDKQAIELSGSVDLAGKLAAARERAKKQG